MREQIARIIGECGDEYYLQDTASPEQIANQIIALLKQEGYVKLAKDQSLPGWQSYIWPETTQSQRAMRMYQTGIISKNEHEDLSRQLHGEELKIYNKAQEDMVKANFKKVELEGKERQSNPYMDASGLPSADIKEGQ